MMKNAFLTCTVNLLAIYKQTKAATFHGESMKDSGVKSLGRSSLSDLHTCEPEFEIEKLGK